MLGAVTARAAKKATTSIPIVFAMVVDPVADDVVASLERPGGNVTGVTSFDPQQARKQLELFREVLPGLKRVAILGDQGVSEALMKANEGQARALGLQTQRLRVAGPNPDLEGALAAVRQENADALLILEEPILVTLRKRIAELAAKYRLPTMFARDRADAGGLIAYGTSVVEAMRRMAPYVDKVLKGAKPGALPVETVTRQAERAVPPAAEWGDAAARSGEDNAKGFHSILHPSKGPAMMSFTCETINLGVSAAEESTMPPPCTTEPQSCLLCFIGGWHEVANSASRAHGCYKCIIKRYPAA